MPISECDNCGGCYHWNWEEAFDKFGFNDGDGQVETWAVASILEEAGYTTEVNDWSMHNTVIVSIKKGTLELVPHDDPAFSFGYDNPRKYLPRIVVDLLDHKLGKDQKYF